MSDAAVTQLGHLVLGVADVDGWTTFATEVLGLSVGRRTDAGVELRMDDRSYRIVLEPNGDDDVVAIGWQVAGPDELDALERRLTDAGIAVHDDPDLAAARRVGRLLRVTDPSGIRIELHWGPEMAVGEPFVPGRPVSGFLTGPYGLGHVVLSVDDVAAHRALYEGLLGFELTDYGNGPFTFLRCNPRHHSVAFGPAAVVRSPKRLLHFMVEMTSLDDVGTAYDLCHDRGIPIAITLGRHTNDRMVSFYAHTPSGFRFECGWGGLLVGDDWVVQGYRSREVWGHLRIEETLRSAPGAPADEEKHG